MINGETRTKTPLNNSPLIVDQTGVGQAVMDMLRRVSVTREIWPVTITTGLKMSNDYGSWSVPKKDLVATMQVLLQTRRIKVAEALAEAEMLATELTNFQAKVPPASAMVDPVAAWREGQHDDLVLTVVMTAWHAERQENCSDIGPLSLGKA